MVDSALNGVIIFLLIGIVYSLLKLGDPLVKSSPVTRSVTGDVPLNWVDEKGRWSCESITPLGVDQMLKALRHQRSTPRKIRIEPPRAEVVWS